ncbi:MAG: protein kinase, partial [Runella zeae]
MFLSWRHAGGGTILYLAPEVVLKPEYGLSADVFSFGICLFEILFLREHPESDFCVEGFFF